MLRKYFLKDSFKLEIMIFIYCTLYIFVYLKSFFKISIPTHYVKIPKFSSTHSTPGAGVKGHLRKFSGVCDCISQSVWPRCGSGLCSALEVVRHWAVGHRPRSPVDIHFSFLGSPDPRHSRAGHSDDFFLLQSRVSLHSHGQGWKYCSRWADTGVSWGTFKQQ